MFQLAEMPLSLLLVEVHGQGPRVSVFADSLIDLKAGGEPKASPLGSTRGLSSFDSSKAPCKVF